MRYNAGMRYGGRAAKVDANQPEIVAALIAAGVTVAEIGKPLDLLCGYLGVNHILEVKNPNGKNRLEPDQVEFIGDWKGRKPVIVRNPTEALNAVGAGAVSER